MSKKIPILFIVFNRIDLAKKVFESIKEYEPEQLFISSDGYRNFEEKTKVTEIREYIIDNITWDCKVFTKFNDVNLGCNLGPSSAISWFFSVIDCGIILEDDCIPDITFYNFCAKYLKLFKNDKRIWHISGSNLLGNSNNLEIDSDILFSKFTFVWGWATWADRWEKYDSNLSTFDSDSFIIDKFTDTKDQRFWIDIYNKVKQKVFTSCWDYQWTFICWRNNALSIVPKYNLIKNIGFTNDATHTTNPNPFLENLKVYKWTNSFKDNFIVIDNERYDHKVQKFIFRQYLFIRVILKITKIFYKMKLKYNI